MDDALFHDLIDAMMRQIEDAIDEQDLDVDIDTSGGLLTIECFDGSSIILSRQVANHELWIAARSGGYHLRYRDDAWTCDTTQESLVVLLNRLFTEQMGRTITLLS